MKIKVFRNTFHFFRKLECVFWIEEQIKRKSKKIPSNCWISVWYLSFSKLKQLQFDQSREQIQIQTRFYPIFLCDWRKWGSKEMASASSLPVPSTSSSNYQRYSRNPTKFNVACRYFRTGCKFGSNCKYLHNETIINNAGENLLDLLNIYWIQFLIIHLNFRNTTNIIILLIQIKRPNKMGSRSRICA